jgi:hypothetical protein
MNIVLAVALVPGGFAAVAAHTDELGHELWVFQMITPIRLARTVNTAVKSRLP